MFSVGDSSKSWPQFVAYEATTHDSKAHIFNLEIASRRASIGQGTPEYSKLRKVRFDMLIGLKRHHAAWAQSVQNHLSSERSLLHAKDPNCQTSDGKLAQHLINQLVEDLEEIHNFNPKDDNLMAPVTCVEALPPMAQFYHEMNAEARINFWQSRLTMEIASQVWAWAKETIPIQENLDSEHIGHVMRYSFSVAAAHTYRNYVMPQLEEQELRLDTSAESKMIQSCGKMIFKPDPFKHLKAFLPSCPG
ncbi:MAG: hypothetical protein Q9186_000228 [Xanthomendoza sp. 1 TL-2023]